MYAKLKQLSPIFLLFCSLYFHLLLKYSAFHFSEIRITGIWRSAHSHCKWNRIINFVISVKLYYKKHFLQRSLKAYIFYAIRFLYVLQKKSWNKLWMGTHYFYFGFNTFFSQVNNNFFLLNHRVPLNKFMIFVNLIIINLITMIKMIIIISISVLLQFILMSTISWRFFFVKN